MIPMLDLKAQYETLRTELEPAIGEALAATQFILGPNVQAFETEVAAYLGVDHAVSCASGTDALHLAIAAAGIGPGDEVITTPFTFIATAEAICYVGATPVFVDIDPETFNLDLDAVEDAITANTKAILPVHLFGQPVDMERLNRLACSHGLLVIEDCAQSFGARVGDAMTGSQGIAGCFSFFPSKNLGCYGDGGLISTTDSKIAEQLKVLRNHGQTRRYHHEYIGYNSRLDELQAVILRHKLPHIDAWNAERRRVADRYDAGLADLPLRTPVRAPHGTHVFHQYTVTCDRRDAIADALKTEGIGNAIYYPVPLHRQPAFAGASTPHALHHAEDIATRCLSLPMFPELDNERIDTICATVRQTLNG